MKLTTSLSKLRSHRPCADGWRKLVKHLGKDYDPDAEINLLTILESNGIGDMLWALRATEQDSKGISSRLAIEFAEQALPIFEERFPADKRPRKAIEAAKAYLSGEISLEELRWYREQAADAASANDDAARTASYAYAAYAASYAAACAAYAAADAAAYDDDAAYAAYAAAYAARTASYAAANAAYAAAYAFSAREKAREKQAEIIRTFLME